MLQLCIIDGERLNTALAECAGTRRLAVLGDSTTTSDIDHGCALLLRQLLVPSDGCRHLLTFLTLRQPGLLFRFWVMLTQASEPMMKKLPVLVLQETVMLCNCSCTWLAPPLLV